MQLVIRRYAHIQLMSGGTARIRYLFSYENSPPICSWAVSQEKDVQWLLNSFLLKFCLIFSDLYEFVFVWYILVSTGTLAGQKRALDTLVVCEPPEL